MPVARTILIYKFDELSDKAKEKARDWWREASVGDNDFADAVIEDAVRMGNMLGITFGTHPVGLVSGKTRMDPKIWWSGFSSQGDGACFEGTYYYAPNAVAAVTEETGDTDKELIRIAQELTEAQAPVKNWLTASISHRGNYSHARTMDFEFEYPDSDEAFADEEFDAAKTQAEEAVAEALRDFANWIYKRLNEEYDYQNTDEYIDDTIRANEYDFLESGKRA